MIPLVFVFFHSGFGLASSTDSSQLQKYKLLLTLILVSYSLLSKTARMTTLLHADGPITASKASAISQSGCEGNTTAYVKREKTCDRSAAKMSPVQWAHTSNLISSFALFSMPIAVPLSSPKASTLGARAVFAASILEICQEHLKGRLST